MTTLHEGGRESVWFTLAGLDGIGIECHLEARCGALQHAGVPSCRGAFDVVGGIVAVEGDERGR